MPQLATRDACDLLDADHIATKHLFVEYARLAMAAPRETATRQPLALRICDELTVHARIEEELFYPALGEAVPAARRWLDEAQAEHAEAKALIERIRRGKRAGAELDELVSLLARAVERHVKEERDHLFPKARSAPALDLDGLGAALQERQQQLQGKAGR